VVLGGKSGGGLPSAIIKFELKFEAMGGFPVSHGLFYFCFSSRWNSEKGYGFFPWPFLL